jgi:hypothetical protein
MTTGPDGTYLCGMYLAKIHGYERGLVTPGAPS